MMQELRKYQINIFDETYTILSDESEQEINETVGMVDSLIKEITSKSSAIDSKKVAIFVALKIAGKFRALQFEYNKFNEKEKLLIQSIEKELSI